MEKEDKTLLGECLQLVNYIFPCIVSYRLKKYEIMMILSPGQFYCVSLSEERKSIQLDVILDKNTETSAKNRSELMEFFQSTLEQICQEVMAAATKPVGYVPCPHCPKLHIKFTNLFKGGVQLCKTKSVPLDYYQDLFKSIQGTFVKLTFFTQFNYCITSSGVSDAQQLKG